MANPYAARGFTLLELLVVLLVIGLAIGMVSITNPNHQSLIIKQQAQQFAHYTALLAEEALLDNSRLGIDLYRGASDGEERYGYRWLSHNNEGWQVQTLRDIPNEHLLPSGIQLRLTVNTLDYRINDKKPEPDSTQHTTQQQQLIPAIELFSNGEITPFALVFFYQDKPDDYYRIQGDLLGRMAIDDQAL